MARIQSERLRGKKPPTIDYKIGNGGLRDLFKYIFGGQEARGSMKIVKTRNGKKTTVKDIVKKNIIAKSVNNSIARVNADSQRSNEVSYMAGQKASSIQQDMANAIAMQEGPVGERRDVTGELREAATYPPSYKDTLATGPTVRADTRPDPIQKKPFIRAVDFRAYEPPSDIYPRGERPHNLPEKPVQAGGPTIRVEDDAYAGDPEVGFGRSGKNFFGEGQVGFRYGGAVTPKRKKRKKRLYKGGKVTSYNY